MEGSVSYAQVPMLHFRLSVYTVQSLVVSLPAGRGGASGYSTRVPGTVSTRARVDSGPASVYSYPVQLYGNF